MQFLRIQNDSRRYFVQEKLVHRVFVHSVSGIHVGLRRLKRLDFCDFALDES